MDPSMLRRLEELRGEHALGTRRLEELSMEFDSTRETVLRISGAIQVLEELLTGGADRLEASGPDKVGAGVLEATHTSG